MNIGQTAEDKFQKAYAQPTGSLRGKPLNRGQTCIVERKNLAPPPLENGDRLTRCEFERRYDAMPHIKKAELIEGVVYMASPVRFKSHGEPHARIVGRRWGLRGNCRQRGFEQHRFSGNNGSVD